MTEEARGSRRALPSPGFSVTLRVKFANVPGRLGALTTVIGSEGGDIGTVDIVSASRESIVRDITVNTSSDGHANRIVEAIERLEGFDIVDVSDLTFQLHRGGKIEIVSKTPLKTRADLSMAYTPGVARVCEAIRRDPDRAFTLTIKKNSVAVVSDGTAVLGLGNIGPAAAMPVMEGKAMLFKEFGGIDAFPICLNTTDPDRIVETVKAISPGFGGINLEDISSPRCFEIEDRLKEELDIPVFHDDQHGTAVVVLAALLNALRIVGKDMRNIRVVVNGIGAAGVACTKIMMAAGVGQIVGCDTSGAIFHGRHDNMNWMKEWYATHTNSERQRGTLQEVLRGADVFIGLSAPHVITLDDVKRMAPHPMVFAMANPIPEIMPEDVAGHVAVMATGRSDYPNQINNVLCFPGIFRGALACRARSINEEMKLAAARAIAATISSSELHPDYVVPSVFDKRVAEEVAQAVEDAAFMTGVARGERTHRV